MMMMMMTVMIIVMINTATATVKQIPIYSCKTHITVPVCGGEGVPNVGAKKMENK